MITRSRVGDVAVVVLALVLSGCLSLRGMREVPAERVNVKPPAGQAAVVFLRTANVGTTTSLYEVRPPQDTFIGLLVNDTRLVYFTAPGKMRFMVVGLSANFLDAELEAGKTYQVVVAPGPDAQQHFRLEPVRPGVQPSKVVQNCLESCRWVENTDESQAWYRQHANSVQRKKAQYLPLWERRQDRPVLTASDGR